MYGLRDRNRPCTIPWSIDKRAIYSVGLGYMNKPVVSGTSVVGSVVYK